jgi:hypothetical protein
LLHHIMQGKHYHQQHFNTTVKSIPHKTIKIHVQQLDKSVYRLPSGGTNLLKPQTEQNITVIKA